MKKILLAILLLAIIKTNAQELPLKKKKIFVGYFGETLAHPGINLGIEHYPYQTDQYQMILSANIGGYIHKRNNTSIFLRGQWGQRITFENGVLVDSFLGLGYLHHLSHGGAVYEVLPNGAIVENTANGNSMIMPSVAVGTGYDFSKKTNLDMIIYVRPELFWKAPFNGYYLTHIAINCGLIFNIPGHEK